MSTVRISEYRGWYISFDTEEEKFHCMSERWDQQEARGSYAAVKKFIDEFIKNNSEFKPLKVFRMGLHGKEMFTVVGVRKDGRLVATDAKGQKDQIGDYQLNNYFINDPETESIMADIEKAYKANQATHTALREQEKRLAPFALKWYAEKHIKPLLP